MLKSLPPPTATKTDSRGVEHVLGTIGRRGLPMIERTTPIGPERAIGRLSQSLNPWLGTDSVDVPAVDPKGTVVEWPSSGWLPAPLDDAVAMLIQTGHTPGPQVIRGRECWYAGSIDVLLMPFGKGTLVGPRNWVIAASDQLDSADCTCGFPDVTHSTGSGHRSSCPVHRRWLDDAIRAGRPTIGIRPTTGPRAPVPEAEGGPAGLPLPPTATNPLLKVEDRGWGCWVWWNATRVEFHPFPEALGRAEISVPVPWSLATDPESGVTLRNPFRHRMLATEALRLAEAARRGFLVRSSVLLEKALAEVPATR